MDEGTKLLAIYTYMYVHVPVRGRRRHVESNRAEQGVEPVVECASTI